MATDRWNQRTNRAGWSLCAALVVTIGLTAASAQAQVVQDCQPTQYLDRTAPAADRQLTWDFSIATDPERCLQVQVGQTVVWNGDVFDTHPLGGSGGDSPNPIGLHVNGAVTFTNVGTFGFQCLNHSIMKGAIKVVAATAPPPSVPALSRGQAVSLTALLLAGALLSIRRARRRSQPT